MTPQERKTYDAERWQKNKELRKGQKRAQIERVRAEVQELKKNPCMDCSQEFHPAAMQFDHRPGTEKLFNIGDLMSSGYRQKLLDEIAKCDLVCANCHALRTYVQVHSS